MAIPKPKPDVDWRLKSDVGFLRVYERGSVTLFAEDDVIALADSTRPEGLSDVECEDALRAFGVRPLHQIVAPWLLPCRLRNFRVTARPTEESN